MTRSEPRSVRRALRYDARRRGGVLSGSARSLRLRWIGPLACLLALGCGDPEGVPDAETPPDSPAVTCGSAVPFEAGSTIGRSAPLAVIGQAAAGRVLAAQLPPDPDGLAAWRDGDFVLANGRVAVVVSDVTGGQLYDPHGGRIVGLARVEAGALVDPADYNLVMMALGRFIVATETVSVIADGSDGGPAIVRAAGPLTRIRSLADLLDSVLPEDFEGLHAALDYRLAPDADVVDVTLRVRARESAVRARLGAVQVFFQSYRMPAWRPGTGFRDGSTAPVSHVVYEGRATSFAFFGEETLTPLFATGGVDLYTSGRLVLAGCAEGELLMGRIAVSGPGLPGPQALLARRLETETILLTGAVTASDGAPAPDARVHVTTADGEHLTRFLPDADGTFSVEVDARAARLFAWREGQPLVGPVPVSTDPIVLSMPPAATLRVSAVSAASLTGIPARIEIFPAGAAPERPPEDFGEPDIGGGRVALAFPADGAATFRLAPGAYRVWVSRGPEHDRYETDVVLAADTDTPLTAELTRVVDTTGVQCADFHIHSHRSVDSPDRADAKVASLVADGVEIAVRSEHEWVNDFQPILDRLELSEFARGLAGLELTTFTYGHFGVFPLEPDPTQVSNGAISWYDRLAPDVFEEVRARPEAPALIINHPRAGGLRQGYFTVAGFDPTTGTVSRPELWDESFSVVEVFNGSDFRSEAEPVRDWFALLNMGRRVFAVGSSDSHDLFDTPVGYPRTCLRLGTDDPREVTGAMVRDATMAGHGVVSGGIYMDVTGPSGVGPGDEAAGVGARATIDVVLRAAPHVAVDRLEVIVDGETVETIAVATDREPIRATMALEVEVAAAGSWVVLHAAGDEAFDANGHRSFAVSNPIFLRR